jgi:hypothetical protein
MIKGYKHRINQLFKPVDAVRLDSAVQYVHNVMSDATQLIKYRLLKAVRLTQRQVAPMVVDESLVNVAIRAVLSRRDPGSTSIRKGCRATKTGDAETAAISAGQRQGLLESWIADYTQMQSDCNRAPPALYDPSFSVSHMFTIAAKQASNIGQAIFFD